MFYGSSGMRSRSCLNNLPRQSLSIWPRSLNLINACLLPLCDRQPLRNQGKIYFIAVNSFGHLKTSVVDAFANLIQKLHAVVVDVRDLERHPSHWKGEFCEVLLQAGIWAECLPGELCEPRYQSLMSSCRICPPVQPAGRFHARAASRYHGSRMPCGIRGPGLANL